jgi:cytochrome c peroxidase
MMFKVPSLRNIEKTGPYYHDGSVATLEDAVKKMADYQLGKKLADPDVQAIVAWLKTLTGEVPADYIKPPALPTPGA